jgi:hypothetical protein
MYLIRYSDGNTFELREQDAHDMHVAAAILTKIYRAPYTIEWRG